MKLSASDFGTTGLIDTPSARMLEDGDFKATLSKQKIANLVNLTYQATPWLETTFRYSVFNPDNPIRNSLDIDGLNDRSYGVKLKLLKEGKFLPQLALGIRDIMGTGAWSSEYFVASKKINRFDASLGIGWGRLAERSSFNNPFDSKAGNNPYKNSALGGKNGGKIRINSFFKGKEIGLFGGFSYSIPEYRLKILAEYNSDAYEREIRLNTIKKSSPLSYGVEWEIFKDVKLKVTKQQGNEIGLSVSSLFNTSRNPPIKELLSFYSSSEGRARSNAPDHLNFDSWYDLLLYDMERSGLLLRNAKVSTDKTNVNLEISNMNFAMTSDAIRNALVLSNIHLPYYIKNINLILNESGFRIITISYKRSTDNKFYVSKENTTNRTYTQNIKILDVKQLSDFDYTTKYKIPHIHFNADISSRFQLFDPDKPIKSQAFLKVGTVVQLYNNWTITGMYSFNIDNNFDLNRGPSSALPHVRTDINRYLVEGSSGIQSLYLQNKATLSRNTYYRFYAGILEDMFAGIGIEVLHQPYRSRLAYGVTVNSLKKRGFKRNLDLINYNTTTGYFSLYYASKFYNYDFALHAGRYLAKDRGFTLEARRTFDNGFSIGAFATFTNVSEKDFGEGSFDKGLYFKLPMNYFSKNNTKSMFSTVLRSIQRDGGQRLEDFSGRLWFDLRNVRYDSLNNNRDRMTP